MADMADAASQNELIAQFTGVTGVDADRAKFFLESAAWKLDVAIAAFYEDDDGSNVDPAPAPSGGANPPAGPPSGGAPRQSGSSRIATIAGFGSQEDSDDEEGEAYYAGGSERGAGQQIIGPPKKKPGQLIQDMFDSAKEHGAEEVSASGSGGGGGGGGAMGGGSAFRGMGFRLGDTETQPSESVMGLPKQVEAREVDNVLKLWKNGFSVDDGPLRDFQDENNKEFLESIRKGEIPKELTRLAKGGTVNLNMEDHRTEEFVKPRVTLKAFSGEGYKLGSPAPTVVSPSANSGASALASAQSSVNVDSSQPTTSLQIRLSDGTRMVAKFNHTHTISDVRTYITAAHPQFASVNFVLMTTFPNKELTEETQTLETAQLLNAVLVQRVK